MEIRDAALQLRPFVGHITAADISRYLATNKVSSRQRDAAARALRLACAVRNKAAGYAPKASDAADVAVIPSGHLGRRNSRPSCAGTVVAHRHCCRPAPQPVYRERAAMTNTAIPHSRLRLPIIGDLLTVDFAKPAQGLSTQIRKLDSRHHGAAHL